MSSQRRIALPALVGLVIAATAPVLAAPAGAAEVGVSSLAVKFHVKNTDTSAVQCDSDDAAYDVVGHLTGPSDILRTDLIPAATLYLHGDGVDESFWRYSKFPGYDYAGELAERGLVSVTITRLGYAGSGKPDGDDVCFGSEADVAHQIVGALRTGAYQVAGIAQAPHVEKVGLAGHSASGFVAMAEAYSYHDIADLVVVASGEYVTPRVPAAVLEQQARCPNSDEDGYAFIEASDAEAAADFFHDADQAVVTDVTAHRPKDSCGGLAAAPTSVATDLNKLREVKVPVLVITGDSDAFFAQPEQQAKLFSGSPDATGITLADTGHAITLGHSAAAFRDKMIAWLTSHGLGGSS
ncbi:MAG TPA: alpha/beta hydrolase [Sporichthyaceae bacterium]|jgi:pimeloyl-ACP methyl ester carboxylesterase|nr:alpha/beta hydrolase [Sporichthyaceae bacterium]